MPEGRPPAARVVARARPLHLDDVRAQVRQDLRAERAGEVLPELDDRDAVQGKRHDTSVTAEIYARASGAIRTSILPVLAPVKSPAKARGALSRPSTTVSCHTTFLSRTHPPISRRNSSCTSR